MAGENWMVCWTKDRALINAERYQREVWEISNAGRPGSTWSAYVVKTAAQPIAECRDHHFADLMDDPKNYTRIK